MVSISMILLPIAFAANIHDHLSEAIKLNFGNDPTSLAQKILRDDDTANPENVWTYNTKHGHDILDESVLYEFMLSGTPFSKRSLNRFLRQYYTGDFRGLSDTQYNFVMNQWIYQMLPAGF